MVTMCCKLVGLEPEVSLLEAAVADSVVVDLAAVAEALVAADLAVVTTMGGVFTLMESQTLEITLHARQRWVVDSSDFKKTGS